MDTAQPAPVPAAWNQSFVSEMQRFNRLLREVSKPLMYRRLRKQDGHGYQSRHR